MKRQTAMKITADDLVSFGIVEEIIAEPQGGAHQRFGRPGRNDQRSSLASSAGLSGFSAEQLIVDRYEKFRKIGKFKSPSEAA